MSPVTNTSPPTQSTPSPPAQPNHARSFLRSSLTSALHTATAVAAATLYFPPALRHHLSFPALSYVTATLIVADATLADSLYSASCALYATALGSLPAVLGLFLIGPDRFSAPAAAIAVAVSSFVVSLQGSSWAGLLTKRIAFAQAVIVYSAAYKHAGSGEDVVLIPARVAASTAVGAAAAVVALVVPYPRLACYEVKENNKLYMNMSLERIRFLVDAFCADDNIQKDIATSQAKSLTTICTKLIRIIKLKQVNIIWEMTLFKVLGHITVPSDVLEAIELPLKGMEIALASIHLPVNTSPQQSKTHVFSLREYLRLKHKGCKDEQEMIEITQQTLDTIIPQKLHDFPSLHFLFCMRLLHNSHLASPTKKVTPTSCKEELPNKKKAMRHWCPILKLKRLVVALKCSISLGLAMLFGLLFSKEEGIWSGLILAFALAPCREATFRLANTRAQGTALGTVYGVLGSIVSQNLMEARFLILLAWIIFTSFLCRSRIYGHAGGMAANISAIFILGRRNYGSPTTFAIARLTEAFIGLSCFMCAELLLQPKRASSLARAQLCKCFQMLHECVQSVNLNGSIVHLEESRHQLRLQVDKLMKYIAESEGEPDFWFMPFPTCCYKKLHLSLSQIVHLIYFLSQGIRLLAEVSHEEAFHEDLESFRRVVGSSVECLKEVIHVKSIASLEKEMEKRRFMDVEQGKTKRVYGNKGVSVEKEESEKVVASFLQHTRELMETLDADHIGEELKGHVVLCLGAVGFCMDGLMRETRELEKGILELVQWENPNRKIDLHDISCKVKELSFVSSS